MPTILKVTTDAFRQDSALPSRQQETPHTNPQLPSILPEFTQQPAFCSIRRAVTKAHFRLSHRPAVDDDHFSKYNPISMEGATPSTTCRSVCRHARESVRRSNAPNHLTKKRGLSNTRRTPSLEPRTRPVIHLFRIWSHVPPHGQSLLIRLSHLESHRQEIHVFYGSVSSVRLCMTTVPQPSLISCLILIQSTD